MVDVEGIQMTPLLLQVEKDDKPPGLWECCFLGCRIRFHGSLLIPISAIAISTWNCPACGCPASPKTKNNKIIRITDERVNYGLWQVAVVTGVLGQYESVIGHYEVKDSTSAKPFIFCGTTKKAAVKAFLLKRFPVVLEKPGEVIEYTGSPFPTTDAASGAWVPWTDEELT